MPHQTPRTYRKRYRPAHELHASKLHGRPQIRRSHEPENGLQVSLQASHKASELKVVQPEVGEAVSTPDISLEPTATVVLPDIPADEPTAEELPATEFMQSVRGGHGSGLPSSGLLYLPTQRWFIVTLKTLLVLAVMAVVFYTARTSWHNYERISGVKSATAADFQNCINQGGRVVGDTNPEICVAPDGSRHPNN